MRNATLILIVIFALIPLCVFLWLLIRKKRIERWNARHGVHGSKRDVFLRTSFSVMGYVSSMNIIEPVDMYGVIESIMNRLDLDEKKKSEAKGYFKEGQGKKFSLSKQMESFVNACGDDRTMVRLFMEFQLRGCLSDGRITLEEREVISLVAYYVGWTDDEFDELENEVASAFRFQWQLDEDGASLLDFIFNAYKVLGVEATMTNADITRVYRRLMSKHHPDRLIAQGVPEEMIRIATDKASEISSAYSFLMKHRGESASADLV